MNAELLALADNIEGSGRFSFTGDYILLPAMNKRDRDLVVAALRLVAQSPEPVAWLSTTEWGDKELSFVPAKNPQWRSIPLYTAPLQSASDGALREALDAIRPYLDAIICFASSLDEHEGNRVAAMVEKAFAASEATKSDGSGMRVVEKPRSHSESLQQGPDTSSNPSIAASLHGKGSDAASVANPVAASDRASHVAPGPSDTRPADVTVEVRALIAFVQSVFDFYNEGHSMPMWIGRDARALLDTYKIGAK